MNEGLIRLVEHLIWADGAVIDSLRSQTQLPPRVQEILAHVVAAERVWLARINNEREDVPPVWPDLSLAECRSLGARNASALRELVRTRKEGDFQETIAYTNTRGQKFENTLEDIILHVCVHGSYHRGQIATLMRAGGGVPINTDYITYRRSQGG